MQIEEQEEDDSDKKSLISSYNSDTPVWQKFIG